MNDAPLTDDDVIGFVRPGVDAHSLGIASIARLLENCGYRTVICGAEVADAVAEIAKLNCSRLLEHWLRSHGITRLGFSYRHDPLQAQSSFGRLLHQLTLRKLLIAQGGPLRSVYFAGLPEACRRIEHEYGGRVPVFLGDETALESLRKLGVPPARIPPDLSQGSSYDDARLAFGWELVRSGKHREQRPEDRSGYGGYGTRKDSMVARVQHIRAQGQLPLLRAHVGPYRSNHKEAVLEFRDWLIQLARSGYLDVVSIGTSQLSQSNFGEDWGDRPNGGGVPVNSPDEYREFWNVSRPMLLRTYAGTKNIVALARMYEETLNIAWHALSLWWFCAIDGRGPNEVRANLEEHIEAMRFIAGTGKPFEPNVPHHFSFRGADDVSYVVSGLLAAKAAKHQGLKTLVLQVMLNTPKSTWGVQDLAKARTLLRMVRELEDADFSVILQPRAGLDYFSPDLDKAAAQLAAVSALMDDIEPHDEQSPQMIHVVSYSEAIHLATPTIIDESARITFTALQEYRRLRRRGLVDDTPRNVDVSDRSSSLYAEAKAVVECIEDVLAAPYTPAGLYQLFKAGFLPVPYLWERRDEFKHAVAWKTSIIDGGVRLVDDAGKPVPLRDRLAVATAHLRSMQAEA